MNRVLLFTGKHCSSCRQLEEKIKPYLHLMEEYVYDDVESPKFDKVCDMCVEYRVMNVPTIVIVDKNKKAIETKVGYNPSFDYAHWVNKALKK